MHAAALAWLALLASACTALPQAVDPGVVETDGVDRLRDSTRNTVRKLKGRFLHITDIHPDPFYKVYSSTEGDSACHRGKGPAGYYGAETSDCDSPISLLDATFKWIDDNLRDEVDFVVWTGDSARHDNDENLPRNDSQIVDLNEQVVRRFYDVFGKKEPDNDDDPTNDFHIPIVPTFGNNDIFPHNTFTEGPNRWTKTYLDVWRQFIPEEQRHQFARGGWFTVEVIPNKLAVISLNTLYFFTSNAAVDGCAVRSEPGYEQMEWLRIQLDIMRQRGMKAIVMGHVAPARVNSKTSWDETCWQKYTLWMRQFRDVVVSSIYGHMNIEHFMIQDIKDVKGHVKKGYMYADERVTPKEMGEEPKFGVQAATDYLADLRSTFSRLPKLLHGLEMEEEEEGDHEGYSKKENSWTQKIATRLAGRGKKKKKTKPPKPFKDIGGPFAERYSLSFVSASVVPNYFPTLRVYSYNISGIEDTPLWGERPSSTGDYDEVDLQFDSTDNDADEVATALKSRRPSSKPKKPRRHKFHLPQPPSKASPPGPAYSPQTLSLTSYTQYYANLSHINNDSLQIPSDEQLVSGNKWNKGKHHGKVPKHDSPHPKKFLYKVEYDTAHDKAYALEDLTVRSMLRLAKEMGGKSVGLEADKKKKKHKKKHRANKKWYTFVKRAFVGTLDPADLEAFVEEGIPVGRRQPVAADAEAGKEEVAAPQLEGSVEGYDKVEM